MTTARTTKKSAAQDAVFLRFWCMVVPRLGQWNIPTNNDGGQVKTGQSQFDRTNYSEPKIH
jgi:hypothetical protein